MLWFILNVIVCSLFVSLVFCSFYLGQPGGHLMDKSCPFGFLLELFYFMPS